MGAVNPELVFGANLLTNAAGTYTQVNALRSQSAFERAQLHFNASQANLQAEDAVRRGEVAAQQHLKSGRALQNQQTFRYANQGVELGRGDPLSVTAETAALTAADAHQIRSNAFLESLGYRSQGVQYGLQASFLKQQTRNQARNSIASAGMQAARDFGAYSYLKGIQPGTPPYVPYLDRPGNRYESNAGFGR